MVSHQERARLMEAFMREPVHVAAIILKCSACLLIIGGLAVIGRGTDTTATAANQLQWQRHENGSLLNARWLYQERQSRLERAQRRPRIGISSVDTAAPAG